MYSQQQFDHAKHWQKVQQSVTDNKPFGIENDHSLFKIWYQLSIELFGYLSSYFKNKEMWNIITNYQL